MYFTEAILQLCEWKCVHNFHMSPYVRLIGRLVCQGRAALYNIITSLEQVLFGDSKAHRPKWSDIFGTEVFIPFLRAVSSVHMNDRYDIKLSEHLSLLGALVLGKSLIYRVFNKYCVFSLKFCDFSELCQFCCSAGVLPAWCVYTY